MATTKPHATCTGLFWERTSADAAVDDLMTHGFSRDHVSIVARGREGVDRFHGWDDRGDYRTGDRNEDVSAGEGAVLGGLTGLLIGAGLMLIPGVGPIFAVGPLAAGLAGAVTGGVTGAVTGGIAGGLIDMGVADEDARYYEGRIGEGAYLVTVDCAGGSHEAARDILLRHGADAPPDAVAPPGAGFGTTGSEGTRATF